MRRFMYLLIVLSLLLSCSGKNKKHGNFSKDNDTIAIVDSHFTLLFKQTCCDFSGGDGTYSVLLPDGRTAWIFGDTFIGRKNPDGTRTKKNPMYIRNSCVIQEGDSLKTVYQKVNGIDASWVIHPDIDTHGDKFHEDSIWFWPGDGLIEGEMLKVFFSSFYQADTGMWGFKWTGTWLATFSLPDIIQISVNKIPYSQVNKVHYGHAVFQDKDFTYVYGIKNGRAHVARYAGNNVKNPWEFFNGNIWIADPEASASMSDFHVSEQFSIIKQNNKYILITQDGFLSGDILSYTSDIPYGNWSNCKLLYTTPLPEGNKNLFTYNAVAHPQFIENGKLLISYNTNSFVLQDHFDNADIYRPRFIRVSLKKIDKDF